VVHKVDYEGTEPRGSCWLVLLFRAFQGYSQMPLFPPLLRPTQSVLVYFELQHNQDRNHLGSGGPCTACGEGGEGGGITKQDKRRQDKSGLEMTTQRNPRPEGSRKIPNPNPIQPLTPNPTLTLNLNPNLTLTLTLTPNPNPKHQDNPTQYKTSQTKHNITVKDIEYLSVAYRE
jgi:hypothetical protein